MRLLATPSLPLVVLQNRLPTENLVDETYIQASFIPVTKDIASIGPGPQERYEGVYMMLVTSPTHEGQGPSLDVADILTERFPPSTSFTYDGIGIGITKSRARACYEANSKFIIPVVVDWFTYHQG